MEAFEQFVALAMESEGLLASGPHKFPVRRRTRKAAYEEFQTHGFEVDVIGARRDRLVLATVKSFFGSRGVVAEHVTTTTADWSPKYALLNDEQIRDGVIAGAAQRFGYEPEAVELRLYVGRFAGVAHEARIRDWAAVQSAGVGPIGVHGADDVVRQVRQLALAKQYRDSAVLATLKVLDAAGALA